MYAYMKSSFPKHILHWHLRHILFWGRMVLNTFWKRALQIWHWLTNHWSIDPLILVTNVLNLMCFILIPFWYNFDTMLIPFWYHFDTFLIPFWHHHCCSLLSWCSLLHDLVAALWCEHRQYCIVPSTGAEIKVTLIPLLLPSSLYLSAILHTSSIEKLLFNLNCIVPRTATSLGFFWFLS